MDLRFEELPNDIPCVNCRYDIKFKDDWVGNGTPLFAEFKSYSASTWAGIVASSRFNEQFKNYLASIKNIDELAYVVNTSKADIPAIKKAFQDLFNAKKPEMFEIIWNNQSLRNSLLNNPADEIVGFQNFNKLIIELNDPNVINPILYSFIKTY